MDNTSNRGSIRANIQPFKPVKIAQLVQSPLPQREQCKKKGHFARVCRSELVGEVHVKSEDSNDEGEVAFPGLRRGG